MFGVALLTSTLLALADARIYERCELARDLLDLGIKKEHLATWVCIAFHESRFDTAAKNPYSGDHGLLQISEIYWCGSGKVCGLPCSALRDDDISDDVECALRIYEEHTRLQGNGFLAWVVYPQHCKHNAKKYLADCGSSVKSSSVRTEGRARVLKSQNRNFTNALPYNDKIDKLLPPYLTVSSFLRGSYENQFEQNDNKKIKVDWYNYKLDNVDDLKLPLFNQKVSERYTSTTISTTTTTTPSPLPFIKPPSPRRIESNSFRRRKMRPIAEPEVKFSETTNLPTTFMKTMSTTRAPNNYKENYVTKKNVIQSLSTSAIPITSSTTTTTTTTTIRPSTKYINISTSLASGITQTTKYPIIYTSASVPNTITRVTSTENTIAHSAFTKSTNQQRRPATVKEKSSVLSTVSSVNENSTTKPVQSEDKTLSTSLIDETNQTKKSLIRKSGVSSTMNPLTSASISKNSFEGNSRKLTTATPRPLSTSWYAWRTPQAYQTKASTTSKPSTINWRSAKSWSSENQKTLNESFLTTKSSNNQPTTPKSRITPVWHTSLSTSATKSLFVQSTTLKPPTTWPSANSRSTPSSAIVPSTISTISTKRLSKSTELPATTARTTQSIFDLYLNPTKRPVYSFAPFKNSAYGFRIFANGTTTQRSFSKKDDTKTTPGEPAKNQIRRQA